MSNRRDFKLIASSGQVHVYANGKLMAETFKLSPRKDLVFFLRSANLSPDEIDRVLQELATKGSADFFVE